MNIAIPIYFFIAALLSGLAIPILGEKFGILVFGMFLAPLLIFIPAELILLTQLTLGLIAVGSITYFLNTNILWVVYIVGLAGYFILMVQGTRSQNKTSAATHANNISSELAFFIIFVICLVVSTLYKQPGTYHSLVAIRDYFFLMSAYFIVSRSQLTASFLERLWLFLWTCALIQLPVTIYQFLFVAGKRTDAAQWDAIVGTFIGSKDGGGDSGGLTIFLFSTLVLTLELRRVGAISKYPLFAILCAVITFIAMSEVKVAFILLLFLGAWQLIGNRKASLLSRLATLAAFSILASGLIWIYSEFRQDKSSAIQLQTEKRIEKTLAYTFDPANVDQRGDVGRIAAIVLWVERNSIQSDPFGFFVGHGVGSTLLSKEGFGEIAKKYYPLHVDTNAVSVLLWDSGLIGTICYGLFIFLIVKKAIAARQISVADPWEKGYLMAAPQILIFYALSLFYNKGMLSTSPATQLIFFVFAALAYRLTNNQRRIVTNP